jgi:hypothetical protein
MLKTLQSAKVPALDKITWTTSAVSNDRDGFLADLSSIDCGSLLFHLDDPGAKGALDVRISLDPLMHDGSFSWIKRAGAEVKHPYVQKMGVAPTFTLGCELVDPRRASRFRLHLHRSPVT